MDSWLEWKSVLSGNNSLLSDSDKSEIYLRSGGTQKLAPKSIARWYNKICAINFTHFHQTGTGASLWEICNIRKLNAPLCDFPNLSLNSSVPDSECDRIQTQS